MEMQEGKGWVATGRRWRVTRADSRRRDRTDMCRLL